MEAKIIYSDIKGQIKKAPPKNALRLDIYKILVLFFFICLVILVCFEWIENYYEIQLSAKAIIRAVLLFLFLIVIGFPGTWDRGQRLFITFPLIALGLLFFTYALYEDNLASGLYYSSKTIFWIVGTFFVYRMLLMEKLTQNLIKQIIYIIICIFSIMIFHFMFNLSKRFTQNIAIYVLLWCVPFLMIIKNTIYNKVMIVLAFITVFLSFKRGAIVALTLSTCAYLILYFWVNKSFRVGTKTIFLFMSLLLILSMALTIVYEVRPEFFKRRVADLSDVRTIGSGRGTFYPLIYNNYFDSFHSSPKNFYFGFGSRSVQEIIGEHYGGEGTYAHSDWIQILYDYGLLGILVFASIHLSILSLIFRGIKEEFVHVPALLMNYVIFFLLNIYSGMIFFPNSIYFGLFISLYYYLWIKRSQF